MAEGALDWSAGIVVGKDNWLLLGLLTQDLYFTPKGAFCWSQRENHTNCRILVEW